MLNILVHRPKGGLGDVVMTLSVVRALRRYEPACSITYVGPESCGELLALCPDIDKLRLVPARVDVPMNMALRAGSGTPYQQAFCGPLQYYDHIIDLWCPCHAYELKMREGAPWQPRVEIFLRHAGLFYDRHPEPCPRPLLVVPSVLRVEAYARFEKYPVVALAPRSLHQCRNWPLENWKNLYEQLWSSVHNLVVLGGDRDRDLTMLDPLCYLGRPLDLVAALVERADLLISADSGLLHLAWALGTPTIGLFGATDGPTTCRWYPTVMQAPTTQDEFRRFAHIGRAVCDHPCYYQYKCDAQHCAVLDAIPVERVMDDVRDWIELRRPEPLPERTFSPQLAPEAHLQ